MMPLQPPGHGELNHQDHRVPLKVEGHVPQRLRHTIAAAIVIPPPH